MAGRRTGQDKASNTSVYLLLKVPTLGWGREDSGWSCVPWALGETGMLPRSPDLSDAGSPWGCIEVPGDLHTPDSVILRPWRPAFLPEPAGQRGWTGSEMGSKWIPVLFSKRWEPYWRGEAVITRKSRHRSLRHGGGLCGSPLWLRLSSHSDILAWGLKLWRRKEATLFLLASNLKVDRAPHDR